MMVTQEQLDRLEQTDEYYDWVIDYFLTYPEEYSDGDGKPSDEIIENGWEAYRDMGFTGQAAIAEEYLDNQDA